MAYVQVEADDKLVEGPEGLQFKSFLSTDGDGNSRPQGRSPGLSNTDRGYLQDEEAQRKRTSAFWTIEYYQSYFEVDTQTVLKRCYATLLPTSTNYLSTHLNPADLYGPFWTLTTLVFTLFLSSSLAASISAYLSGPDAEYDYDFQLLSIAVSLVYAYGLALPILLWLGLRYLGVGEWSMAEAVAVWGYGQFIWIPVSILCVVPVPIMRWILVTLAFGLSSYFLITNIYPILASAEAKAMRLIVIALTVLQAGLAFTFKYVFFNYYVVKKIGADIPIPGGDSPATNLTAFMQRAISS